MIITRSRNLLAFLLKPLFIVLILLGVFSIIWVRSKVVTLEYNLGDLEKKKVESLKKSKMLHAEKVSLLSFKGIEGSLGKDYDFVFPDRVRVVYLKKKGPMPYKASLDRERLAEP
ncbi:MAG: hypothetical protein AB1638_12825 [Nitrospirota bacterium]